MSRSDGHYLTTRRDGCTCIEVVPGFYGPNPTPPEWEQADDCPVHPLVAAAPSEETTT